VEVHNLPIGVPVLQKAGSLPLLPFRVRLGVADPCRHDLRQQIKDDNQAVFALSQTAPGGSRFKQARIELGTT
jgi:hypothetical protein